MSQVANTNQRLLQIFDCGLTYYSGVLEIQHRLVEQRRLNEIPDTVLVVEHKPVITLGARQSSNILLASREQIEGKGIAVVDIRRGGGATAHNPGQLVFYPILDLTKHGLAASDYVRKLEAIGISLLSELGLKANRKHRFPGLWVGERKIASIGVRVTKCITYHGMAININNDLGIFDYIVPCGLAGVTMTSVLRETEKENPMPHVKELLSHFLAEHFASEGKISYGTCP